MMHVKAVCEQLSGEQGHWQPETLHLRSCLLLQQLGWQNQPGAEGRRGQEVNLRTLPRAFQALRPSPSQGRDGAAGGAK